MTPTHSRFRSPLGPLVLGLLLGAPLHAQEQPTSIIVTWDLVVSEQRRDASRILIDFTGAGLEHSITHVWTDMRPQSTVLGFGLPDLRASFPETLTVAAEGGRPGLDIEMPRTRGVFVLEGTSSMSRDELVFKGSGFVCLRVERDFGRLTTPPDRCPAGAAKYLVPSLGFGLFPSRHD